MPGSAQSWRTIRRVPGWDPPPPRPPGQQPVSGDLVVLRGVFMGKVELLHGTIQEVYARKGHCIAGYRWLAKINWKDGSKNQIRVERLIPGEDYWTVVAEGKKVWL